MSECKTEYRTSAQVAKVFHMTSKRVQQLTADGIILTVETSKGRRYDWDDTVERYIAHLTDKANGREKKKTVAKLEEDKLRAEVRIKNSKAAIAKMEQDELEGKLHRSEDVKAITTDHVLFMRSMLLSMPGKLAVDCVNCQTAAEVAEIIKSEVYFILNSLADYRYDPDEYRKRVLERAGWEVEHGECEEE